MTNNPQHERLSQKQLLFCQKVVEGLNLSDSYRAAFNAANMKPATVNRAAKELADNPKIAARLAELRGAVSAAVVRKVTYSMQDAMNEAEKMLELAKNEGQAGAGVQAVKLRAQLAGHLAEKKDARSGPLDELDVEKLLLMKAHVEEKLARAEAEEAKLVGPRELPQRQQASRRVIG